MKRLVLFLLTAAFFLVGCSAVKKGKSADKIYEGEYVKSTNTFTYKKDNLVFKDKKITYLLQDDSNTLDLIYNSIGQSHGVTEDDIITLKVSGKVSNGTLIVTRILNYRVPEYKLSTDILELQ